MSSRSRTGKGPLSLLSISAGTKNNGFTLIEVLVAVGLTALLLPALYSAFFYLSSGLRGRTRKRSNCCKIFDREGRGEKAPFKRGLEPVYGRHDELPRGQGDRRVRGELL